MQELIFTKQLIAVCIPRESEEMIEQAIVLINNTDIILLVVESVNYREEISDAIKRHNINTGLMMTFSYRIPSSVYELTEKGFFNVHPGPLPAYRGADPVFRQIVAQEKYAGVTIHKLEESFDTGPIVLKEKIVLDKTDTHGLLTGRLAFLAADMVRTLIKLISFGKTIPSRPQEGKSAKYYKRQNSRDVCIDWNNMNADYIIALINACNPWNKGALTRINGIIVRIAEAIKIIHPGENRAAPGTILSMQDDRISVSVINNDILELGIIYIPEGILKAGRLRQLEVSPGHRFENL